MCFPGWMDSYHNSRGIANISHEKTCCNSQNKENDAMASFFNLRSHAITVDTCLSSIVHPPISKKNPPSE